MKPGTLSRACIRVVARYQRSRGAKVYDKHCRFEPSCSTFIDEAFRTRRFPVAFALVAWRLVRCNPFMINKAVDPVRRRRGVRPNALRTVFAMMFVAGLGMLLVAPVAFGQSLVGGCTATVAGRNPVTMTRNNPLLVTQGQSVTLQGVAPPGAQAGQVNTDIEISIIEGVFAPKTQVNNGNGVAWGGGVNVDPYLDKGTGIYQVNGIGTGPGWICTASGYIKLDGNPLSATAGQAAAGVATVGLVGSAAATGMKKPDEGEVGASPASAADMTHEGLDIIDNLAGGPKLVKPKPVIKRAPVGGCCMIALLLAPLRALPIVGAGGGAMPSGRTVGSQTIWKKGHPIAGFIFGLLFGLGGTVLLQQYAVWPLTVVTAFVVPGVIAILVAIRARIGRAYKVTWVESA